MSKNNFNRRDFLKTAVIAGSSSFLPFGNLSAFAAMNGKAPLRFVQIMSDYSVIAPNFWPKIAPTNVVGPSVRSLLLSSLSANQISTNLQPFASANLLSKITMVRGTSIFTYHDHNQSAATTGSGMVDGQGVTFPFSIDAVLARSTTTYETDPMFRSLSVTPTISSGGANLNFSIYDGRKPSPIWRTKDLADLIFGDPTAAGIAKVQTRVKVIDHVQKRYLALAKQSNIGAEDINRSNMVADILNDIRRRITKTDSNCGPKPTFAQTESTSNEAFQNQSRLIAAALACDQTRVVSLNISTPASASTDDLHEAHHQASANNSHAAVLTAAKNNYYTRVAFFLSQLAATPDIDGRTVLDNTIVLIGNEYGGYGSRAHSFSDMPIIIAGGGDHFRLGEYIDYRSNQQSEESPGRLYNNLLVSIFNAFGLGSNGYERRGLVGFGDYRGVSTTLQDFASNAARRMPLDYIYKGQSRG